MTDWLTNWLTEALGSSRHLNTWAFKRLKAVSREFEGHLGTRALKALGHLASQALGHSGSRKVLGHLGTRGTRGTLFSRLSHSRLANNFPITPSSLLNLFTLLSSSQMSTFSFRPYGYTVLNLSIHSVSLFLVRNASPRSIAPWLVLPLPCHFQLFVQDN